MDDKVRCAYNTWMDTSREFHEQIQRIISGDASAKDGIQTLAKAVRQTHQEFMKAAEPYVRTGPRLK